MGALLTRVKIEDTTIFGAPSSSVQHETSWKTSFSEFGYESGMSKSKFSQWYSFARKMTENPFSLFASPRKQPTPSLFPDHL